MENHPHELPPLLILSHVFVRRGIQQFNIYIWKLQFPKYLLNIYMEESLSVDNPYVLKDTSSKYNSHSMLFDLDFESNIMYLWISVLVRDAWVDVDTTQ